MDYTWLKRAYRPLRSSGFQELFVLCGRLELPRSGAVVALPSRGPLPLFPSPHSACTGPKKVRLDWELQWKVGREMSTGAMAMHQPRALLRYARPMHEP